MTDAPPQADGAKAVHFILRTSYLDLRSRPMRIEIYDTTLRDGSQGEGVNFSLQDKLLITQRLDELGFDYIEGGYPLSNPKDAEYFQRGRRAAAASTRRSAPSA